MLVGEPCAVSLPFFLEKKRWGFFPLKINTTFYPLPPCFPNPGGTFPSNSSLHLQKGDHTTKMDKASRGIWPAEKWSRTRKIIHHFYTMPTWNFCLKFAKWGLCVPNSKRVRSSLFPKFASLWHTQGERLHLTPPHGHSIGQLSPTRPAHASELL